VTVVGTRIVEVEVTVPTPFTKILDVTVTELMLVDVTDIKYVVAGMKLVNVTAGRVVVPRVREVTVRSLTTVETDVMVV
jgi:hypothetical protein